jgi:hypothetical protein
MKKNFLMLVLLMLITAWQSATAQQRRPIDSQHPLWFIHIDVWNSADPQKIIDLIPADIKPYVCMNLSLSCQFDTKTSMYRMPRNAVRTYKSWASVCQKNGMWFSCQPASGGHTHIQDNDLETFEYFFKTYPNFLGWDYAEQFWAFGDAGDLSSMTAASRWALFANLVEMSHKYGGFLTVSWCGGDYHMNTNPMGELKADKNFLAACKKYPEAIVFLYKYTHASSFYNNESICWGPFVSGLTKNYGVRYDNCGWNDMTSKLIGENKCKYPGSAGIGTVMEQMCVNGGAVWDGPELIWREECFLNQNDTNVDGYTRRNWISSPHFKGIWLEMWRRLIDGTMYIPTREEVVNKTKIVVVNDLDISSGYNSYTSWDDLYNNVYLQTDPANQKKEARHNYGQWYNNLCYFKSTGRYGAIPIVMGLYDDAAKAIPLQVKRSNYTSRWGTLAKKQADFNAQYPEVSKGDLYVNRYRNQLVTYTPYTYLNAKKSASAEIPLLYNTCDSLKLQYAKLSSGVIREYADHIDFYFNNYRSDSLTQQYDKIIITGVTSEPTCTFTKPTTNAKSHNASLSGKSYNAETKTFTVSVYHMGAAKLTINCTGEATNRLTDVIPLTALETPKQPEPFKGRIIIEAEDMDRKNVNHKLTNSGWWAQDYKDFAGLGFIETQANTNSALRHYLKLDEGGEYNIRVRYCNSNKAGNMKATVNGTAQDISFEKVAKNDWREAVVKATLKAGTNTLILQNSGTITMTIDQVIYEPVGTLAEKFRVKVREADFGHVVADVDSAVAGQTVHLTITSEDGYGIKALNVVNSIFFTQGKTIPVEKGATEVTFVMPDDNVTIQPVFYDMAAVYSLEFTNVAAGALPEGWRTTDGSDVRNYPTQNGTGPRTFTGLTGYQGKALYWRTTSAEYGRLSDYLLTLESGHYQLIFAMAAWKGTPTYQANIIKKSTGTIIKSSSTLTAKPNINGNAAGNISTAQRNTLDFEVTTKGDYVIRFKEVGSGMQEFLLTECRIRDLSLVTGITTVHAASRWPQGIYSPAGVHRKSLQHGLNIVVDADGNTKKVMIR